MKCRNRAAWQALLVGSSLLLPIQQAEMARASDAATEANLVVDTSRASGPIDLTRYALGQGGLSDQPMIADRIDQISQLHPQTIHIFLQEYFNVYPAHHQYNWATLDRTMEVIRSAGAWPVVSICIKPKLLYPEINDETVAPNDYAEWEELIFQLVKHCNEREFGVKYWIVANEGDIGEPGGVPYKFLTVEKYLEYYEHTAAAIHRADPIAKVGGPSPANARSPQIDALITAAGEGSVPLDILSFHTYSNDPKHYQDLVESMRAKLSKCSKLRTVPTFIDQWNMDLFKPILNPYFQPAFILETTLAFYTSGLSASAYYHIRDYFVDEGMFSRFMSARGTADMARWWNEMPQYDGIYDNQNRMRPAYYAFKLLSLMKGQQLPVTVSSPEIKALAARQGHWVNVVLWNYPAGGEGKPLEVTVQLPHEKDCGVRLVRLNADVPVNNMEQIRHTKISEMRTVPLRFTVRPYEIYWVEVTE